jgi:hypothetical protein
VKTAKTWMKEGGGKEGGEPCNERDAIKALLDIL